MKIINFIHNPGAGKGQHNKKELWELLKQKSDECRYFSTKKGGWKEFDSHADLLPRAGGDGTGRIGDSDIAPSVCPSTRGRPR
mgnify:CR=1 FL=1